MMISLKVGTVRVVCSRAPISRTKGRGIWTIITWLNAETSPVMVLLLADTKSAVCAMAPLMGPVRVTAEARAALVLT